MGLSKNEYGLLEQLISNFDDTQKKNIASLLNTKKKKTKITKTKILKIYKSTTTTKECPHCHSKQIKGTENNIVQLFDFFIKI